MYWYHTFEDTALFNCTVVKASQGLETLELRVLVPFMKLGLVLCYVRRSGMTGLLKKVAAMTFSDDY